MRHKTSLIALAAALLTACGDESVKTMWDGLLGRSGCSSASGRIASSGGMF
jgi:hypothetical protein